MGTVGAKQPDLAVGADGNTRAPPGWHPDPWDETQSRWWDGGAWTGHTGGVAPVLFQDLPTASTVLYLTAERVLAPSRGRWGTRQVACGPKVDYMPLLTLVYVAAFWSLREQGLILLETDDSKRRRHRRTSATLLRAAERPVLEGAIIDALATRGLPMTVFEITVAVGGPPQHTQATLPKRDPTLWSEMWSPEWEGLQCGYLTRIKGRFRSSVGGNCSAIRNLDSRAGELAAAWQRFCAAEPELFASLRGAVRFGIAERQ
jgi:hypothetical protein